MTHDIAEQWEASLAALDRDHEERLAWIGKHIPACVSLVAIREANEIYRLTFGCMYDYFYAGVWK